MRGSDSSNNKMYIGGLPAHLQEPIGGVRCAWFTCDARSRHARVGLVQLDEKETLVVTVDVTENLSANNLLSEEVRGALNARLPDLLHFFKTYAPPTARMQ